MDPDHKKKFALERIILFSDAVFAIAITLLVIELRLPDMKEISSSAMGEALLHMLPHFFSFFLSFFIIGIYWMAHHRTFNYVVSFDNGLVWLNLLLLCSIALMPFSSAVYGVYGSVNTAYYLYTANISIVGLFNFLIYRHIANPQRKLSYGLEDPRLVRYFELRAWAVPACFIVGAILAMVITSPNLSLMFSRFAPILIWPAMKILRKRYGHLEAKQA